MTQARADAVRWTSAGAVLADLDPKRFRELLDLAERMVAVARDPLCASLRDALLGPTDCVVDDDPVH